ncbi:hypothetical protein FQA39_LY02995 [Lamprigera yunnana]|nr:hypothetical protein FQA39_LY02995 [Lamprigera yunnana]
MYAAAGGASLASRQARQKQRKQNKNDRLQQLKNQKLPDKQKQRQFQNYTEPKIQLSRVERNALRPPTLQPESRRHSTSHLKEPSRARIKESPSVLIPIQNHLNQSQQHHHNQGPVLIPNTAIQEHGGIRPSSSIQSQLPQILMPEGEDKMERRCSFVRQVEEMEKCHEGDLLDRCNHICNFEIKDKQPWDSNLTYYSEFHRSAFGSLDYPFSECSQGRAAWQERQGGRRCSLSEEAHQHRLKQVEAHHRWMKRNRIHDSSYGGESEEDIFAIYHQSAAANALLYVGLGTTAIGSVVFFVGSGDKGFKTLELRLIGPTLVACGLLCCLIRILLCACPSTCIRRRKKTRLKNACPHSTSRYPLHERDKQAEFMTVEPTTSLIDSKHKKRVSIAQQKPIPSTSTAEDFQSHLIYKETESDDRSDTVIECKPTIPIITVPDFTDFSGANAKLRRDEFSIELQNLELAYELESVSSNDSDSIIIENETHHPSSKLTRTRVPVHGNNNKETSLSVVVERSDNSKCSGDKSEKTTDSERLSHSGILLSPLQLEQ